MNDVRRTPGSRLFVALMLLMLVTCTVIAIWAGAPTA